MSEFVTVSIIAGNQGEAQTIAAALIERRLAACVQALPITSRFHWQGGVSAEEEVLLIAKTRAGLFAALEECVLALHSYDVPEIVAAPICAGHGPYLDWIAAETEKGA